MDALGCPLSSAGGGGLETPLGAGSVGLREDGGSMTCLFFTISQRVGMTAPVSLLLIHSTSALTLTHTSHNYTDAEQNTTHCKW